MIGYSSLASLRLKTLVKLVRPLREVRRSSRYLVCCMFRGGCRLTARSGKEVEGDSDLLDEGVIWRFSY